MTRRRGSTGHGLREGGEEDQQRGGSAGACAVDPCSALLVAAKRLLGFAICTRGAAWQCAMQCGACGALPAERVPVSRGLLARCHAARSLWHGLHGEMMGKRWMQALQGSQGAGNHSTSGAPHARLAHASLSEKNTFWPALS